MFLPEFLDALFPADRHIDVHFCPFQKSRDHLQVHGGVIHHKKPHTRRREQRMSAAGSGGILQMQPGIKLSHRCLIHHLLCQDKVKPGTFFIPALHLQLTVHDSKELARDRKSQARTFDGSGLLHIQTVKGFKEPLHVLLADPDPGVGHGNEDAHGVAQRLHQFHLKVHFALFGILHRVCQQVCDDLLDADLISKQMRREIRIHRKVQFQTF